jgi:hypothetical protein
VIEDPWGFLRPTTQVPPCKIHYSLANIRVQSDATVPKLLKVSLKKSEIGNSIPTWKRNASTCLRVKTIEKIKYSSSTVLYCTVYPTCPPLNSNYQREFTSRRASEATQCGALQLQIGKTWKVWQNNLFAEFKKTARIQPIRVLIHHLTDKFFAHCPSHPNPLVQQTGNYTLADLTKVYKKYKHKRTKHILL